jgi:adhesin transport system outer membrane protein
MTQTYSNSKMMAAQASVQVAKFQKEQTKLSTYPTINIKGSLNRAEWEKSE